MEATTEVITKKASTGLAILGWVASQDGHTTGATNAQIITAIGAAFDRDRTQSRHVNEAFAAIRDKGLVDVMYRPPHPRLAPSGRVITVTEAGLVALGLSQPAEEVTV
jgi:hypothetical protein